MSRWKMYNPNPDKRAKDDCTVRAIAKALGTDWDGAYMLLAAKGFQMKDMQNGNAVWGAVLRDHGFSRAGIPNTCPDCYTAEDFATDHQEGTYVLGFGDHTAAVVNGQLFDSWDSSMEVPQYYWTNGEE
jgi:hypothetical protein